MIYGIVSYLRSLLFIGFLNAVIYAIYCEINNIYYKDDLNIFTIALIGSIFIMSIYYLKYWKYILMPYSLNLHSIFSHNTFIEVRNTRTLFLDFFLKKSSLKAKSVLEEIYTKDLKKFSLEYMNLTSINIDNYRKNKEKILHYLGLITKDYEFSIYPKKNKIVQLIFYKLPDFYEIDTSFFKKNKIFLGIYEDGFNYRDMNTLDHHLIIGESGSGKSNFMQLLNLNFLFNLHRINKMYLIDLKGGVELKEYENIPNIEFISSIVELDTLLDEIVKDLKATQNFMLENNLRKYDIFNLIIFDEIGAISVYPDKKLKDSIFSKLSLIAMQGRSSSHLLFLFAQKIDNIILPTTVTNNIQSRILLKTSNDYNINIIDLKENIRERITSKEVQDFNKGRAIYKDGLTSEKYLIQFPFISDNFLSSTIKFFSK